MTGTNRAKRLPVPDQLKARIAAERYIIEDCFTLGSEIVRADQDFARKLGTRIHQLCEMGMLYANRGASARIPWSDLAIAQAEIARAHGLVYEKHETSARLSGFARLDPDASPERSFAARAESYLRGIFNGTNQTVLRRLDSALLAHAFALPIPVLEASSDAVFDDFVARTLNGEHLFREGPEFLRAMASSIPKLSIKLIGSVVTRLPRPMRQRRGFGSRPAQPKRAEFPVNQDLTFSVDLPSDLAAASQAVLIGNQAKDWALLSASGLMDDRLDFSGRVRFPRADEEGLAPGAVEAGIVVDTPGDVSFFVVASASARGLEGLPAWQVSRQRTETESGWPEPLSDADFRWLRERILNQGLGGPHGVTVLRRTVNFG